MNRLPKDKRDKIIMVAAGSVLAAVAIWFLLVNPMRGKLAALHQQTEAAKQKVKRGQASVAGADQVAAEVAEATARLSAAEALMAGGDLYDWMIQTINRLKQRHAVVIPQVGRDTACEVGTFPKFPYRTVSFVVRGSAYYHDLGKFIADVENSFPYMRVQNLELEVAAGPKVEDTERLQFKAELVTLVKPVAP